MVEHESAIESDQVTAKQTNVNHEVHGKLNMNEVSEDTKVKKHDFFRF